ncbi:hypothetical protein [Microseira wollei]|nr:hypothetical protein [Microseira wollei]
MLKGSIVSKGLAWYWLACAIASGNQKARGEESDRPVHKIFIYDNQGYI